VRRVGGRCEGVRAGGAGGGADSGSEIGSVGAGSGSA